MYSICMQLCIYSQFFFLVKTYFLYSSGALVTSQFCESCCLSLSHCLYFSCQATIMVYQAIAEYWIGANEEEYEVNVDIKIPGRSKPEKFNFNRENHYTTRTAKVKSHTVTMWPITAALMATREQKNIKISYWTHGSQMRRSNYGGKPQNIELYFHAGH